MSAVAPCGELHICLALFKYAYHGKVAVNTADGFGDDRTTLIAYQEKLDPSALQFCHNLRCTVTAPLFRAGACQIDIGGRDEPFRQEFLHRLEKCHHRAFGIGRASAPYFSFCDISGKRCMNPFTFRRHHILVAHEQDRFLRAFSFPVK